MNIQINFSGKDSTLRLEADSAGEWVHLEIEDAETGDGLHQKISRDEALPLAMKLEHWLRATADPAQQLAPFAADVGVVTEGDAVLVPARIEAGRSGINVTLALVDAATSKRAEIALIVPDVLDVTEFLASLASRLWLNRYAAPAWPVVDRAMRDKLN